ncbi:MAG TPA: PilZ domain-containing protein [Nitrospirota bacterium]
MGEMRTVQRQPIMVKRDCCMGVITFKELAWQDHSARIVDINRSGVGIESEKCVEPGFVWFKDRVWGHRGGILIWSKQIGKRYRAGIRFVPLSPQEEQAIQNQGAPSGIQTPLINPERVVATLIESLQKGQD